MKAGEDMMVFVYFIYRRYVEKKSIDKDAVR